MFCSLALKAGGKDLDTSVTVIPGSFPWIVTKTQRFK